MKVYDELDAAIKAKLLLITEFKTAEEYNDQYRNTEKDDAKDYPASYFEFLEPINWDDAGEGWQHAPVTVRIHVVSFTLRRDKVKLHTLGQKVFKAFHKSTLFGTGGYHLTSKMTRVASSVPKRYKQLKVMTIDFSFEAYDNSGMEDLGTQLVGFTIVPGN